MAAIWARNLFAKALVDPSVTTIEPLNEMDDFSAESCSGSSLIASFRLSMLHHNPRNEIGDVPMKCVRSLAVAAFAVIVLVGLSAEAKQKDIVDTAVAAGSFKTLAAALQAADLVDALKGDGPFTVFAPTDEAFAKLPEGTVEHLLKPENKQKLVAVLTYHVVAGEVPAAKVVKLTAAETLNGQRVDINVAGGKVFVDGAQVLKTDIRCSNGVIHVIDKVILPSDDSVPATAAKVGKFNTLVAAVKAAGLADALSGKGPFTVFAPTDDAFAKLPNGTVETLLKPENRDKLATILKYHVVSGRIFSDAALKAGNAETLQGGRLKIAKSTDGAMVNNARLIATDVDAANGVIHVIDTVLMPQQDGNAATDLQKTMERAVARGSHLFNSGHPSQCARLYAKTMQAMLAVKDHGMPQHAVTAMHVALHRAKRTHNSHSQAWILRHGLNVAYHSMSSDYYQAASTR